jgi:ADP-heptose:LPS heptosyltransferase
MKFTIMRRIDFYLGFLPCHILAVFRKLSGRHHKKVLLPEPIQKVLIIKFLGFGSILMTTPLMSEIKRHSPETEIHFLTFSDNLDICSSIGLIDKVFDLEKKSMVSFTLSLFRTLFRLRRENYDVVFNLEFFSNFSLLVTALTKAKLALCFGGRHEFRKILCQRIISYESHTYIVDKFCNFLKMLNITPSTDLRLTDLQEKPEAKQRIQELMKTNDLDSSRDFLVLINVNTGEMSEIRRWPLAYYQQVIEYLLSQEEVKIILIGGKGDVEYVSRLEDMILAGGGRMINLSGKISLEELIPLMKTSHLYLGNDSGPLHLAEACGLANVSFFGPESPKVYGHHGDKNTIFYSNLPCSPCLNVYTNKDTRCTDNICLKLIKPDVVIKVLQERYFEKKEKSEPRT